MFQIANKKLPCATSQWLHSSLSDLPDLRDLQVHFYAFLLYVLMTELKVLNVYLIVGTWTEVNHFSHNIFILMNY